MSQEPSSSTDLVAGPRFDEVHGRDGAPFSYWRGLEASLLRADRGTRLRAQDLVRRLRRSQGTLAVVAPGTGHGVVPASGGGGPGSDGGLAGAPEQLRGLDPVPHIVPAADWRTLEAGLLQRARLFEGLLADVYGPETLVQQGVLPAEVVYGYDGFLRPCRGIDPGRRLIAGAVDVMRSPAGEFAVRGDRTSVARGLGGTLSARRVLSVTLSDQYRRLRVQRIDDFYDTLRSTLAGLATSDPAKPDSTDSRTAILSPGPQAEAFPEHAYLARSLGFTLVSGSDLTVRDGQVWVRSVGGLEGVDVLLRLVDDDWCDPLELRAGSRLGPPGLLEAHRRGQVALGNALGSGFLENPGLAPFLPAACRALLGEELLLRPVPAWWCGDGDGLSHVLTRAEELILRPLGRGTGHAAGRRIEVGRLDRATRDDLLARVRARPGLWVGEEPFESATAPLVHDGRVVPSHLVLRSYFVADGAGGEGFSVMPGGLARARIDLPDGGGPVIVRKDAWVLADGPRRISLPVLSQPQIDLGASLPSRNAEALYWMGRHAEAAETVIRLVQTIASELGETPELTTDADGAWVEIFAACLGWTAEPARTLTGSPAPSPAELLADRLGGPVRADPSAQGELPPIVRHALVDEHLPRSLVRSLAELSVASLSARELLSTHTCLVLATLEDRLAALRAVSDPGELDELIGSVLTNLMALVGLSAESMVRDPGWLFIDIGRRVERARLLVRVVAEALVPDPDPEIAGLVHETLLAGCESLVAYRRRYRSDIEVAALAHLLLTDPSNPRSLAFQADRILGDLRRLPGEQAAAIEPIGAALGGLLVADLPGLLQPSRGRRPKLRDWLSEVSGQIDEVAESINLTYFAHVPVQTVSMAAADR